MARPPANPEDFDKVNYVIDSWTTGCDAPWYIYIETMKPAALEAFIVLITFGWADVLRGALRPKGLGRRTGKRKGKWARRIPAFPEIGNTIGKGLPFAEQLEDFVKWGQGARTLWRIDNAMQAALFMWLVADVAEDFIFNWTSLLYESYWCQDDAVGRFSTQGTGMHPRSTGVWWLVAAPESDYQNAPPSFGFQSGNTGSVWANITAAVSVETLPGFPPPTGLQVRIVGTTINDVLADSGLNDDLDGGSGACVATGLLPPHTWFEVRVRISGTGWASFGNAVVLGFEVPQ